MISEFRRWFKETYDDDFDSQELRAQTRVVDSVLDYAIRANLLFESPSGEIATSDSEKIIAFSTLIRRIRNSLPRLTRWAAYYLLTRKNSFATDEFLDLIVPNNHLRDTMKKLKFVTARRRGKQIAFEFDPEYDEGLGKSLFLGKGDNLRVNPKLPGGRDPFSLLAPFSDKVLGAALALRTRKTISEKAIISQIREIERPLAEKYLSQVLERRNSAWTVPGQIEEIVRDLEEPLRRPKGEIEDSALRLLDSGGFSNDQLSRLLEADPSTISRSIKRLSKERLIVGTEGFGEYRRRFWITNCDNCPWSLSKDDCRAQSIEGIRDNLREFGPVTGLDLAKFRNQTLRTFTRTLAMAREQMEGENFRPDIEEFRQLIDMVKSCIRDD